MDFPQFINSVQKLTVSGIPFICLIDVEQQQPQLWPIQDIDPDQLLFATPLGSNTDHLDQNSQVTTHVSAPVVTITQPVNRSTYHRGFHIIQRGLHRGDSFLANLTYPVEISVTHSLPYLFLSSRAPYRLWWKDHFTVFSPEAFISISPEGTAATFPMKGTITANTPDAQFLLMNDPKESAEHLTVVDLLRNDLGRIGTAVRVIRYRYIDRIISQAGDILQASSEIRADLGNNWRQHMGNMLNDILPAGSISGAPKLRTLQLIAEAEQEPRGYYTGIMGHFDGSRFVSGVMIRFIEQRPGGLPSTEPMSSLRFRAGGGITIYSNEEDEYNELHTKVRFPN